MDSSRFDRRDFVRLTSAALGGMVAGAAAGCGGGQGGDGSSVAVPKSGAAAGGSAADVHVCRGLNECKGKGKGGSNECAGQGACATAAPHSCHGSNDCKGQGGCEETAGENACKGQGACNVPLTPKTWEGARARFEKRMAAKGKTVGAAPKG